MRAALDALRVGPVSAGEVAVGSGRTRIAHGEVGIPVPAALELARGWRITAAGPGELATPTGMALIVALAQECQELPALLVDAVGVGAGAKDRDGVANVTRVVIGRDRSGGSGRVRGERFRQIDTNVDDLDPRLWPVVLARLVDAGSADAWLTPILMKKGRPAHTLSVLCRPEQAEAIRAVIFAETSTIGVREHPVARHALARAWVDVLVDGRPVAVKIAHRDGSILQVMPEFDIVLAVADATARSPGDVLAAAASLAAASGLIAGARLPTGARSTRTVRTAPTIDSDADTA